MHFLSVIAEQRKDEDYDDVVEENLQDEVSLNDQQCGAVVLGKYTITLFPNSLLAAIHNRHDWQGRN